MSQPSQSEIAKKFEDAVYKRTKEIEAFIMPQLMVEHEGQQAVDGDKLLEMMAALAVFAGEIIGQYEASMPPTFTKEERMAATEGFLSYFESHREILYKRFRTKNPIFCIEVVTTEEAEAMGIAGDEDGSTPPPAGGGIKASNENNPYLH